MFKIRRIKYRNKTNTFILHKEDGSIVVNPRFIRKIKIQFYGDNNRIEIYEPCRLQGAHFMLYNNDTFVIKKTRGNITVVGSAEGGHSANLVIDEGCTLNNTRFFLNSCPDTFIKLGKDCMFSSDIAIWASDTHQIIDKDTHKVVNAAKKGVVIGDHVWCGTRCTILKGSNIQNNSIIGAASVVSGSFEPNVIIAGNPAKQIKSGVSWKRDALPKQPKSDM